MDAARAGLRGGAERMRLEGSGGQRARASHVMKTCTGCRPARAEMEFRRMSSARLSAKGSALSNVELRRPTTLALAAGYSAVAPCRAMMTMGEVLLASCSVDTCD